MRVSRTRDPTLDVSVTISFKQGNSTQQEQGFRKMLLGKAAVTKWRPQLDLTEQNDEEKSNNEGSCLLRLFRSAFCRCSQKVKNSRADDDEEAKDRATPVTTSMLQMTPNSRTTRNKETTIDVNILDSPARHRPPQI